MKRTGPLELTGGEIDAPECLVSAAYGSQHVGQCVGNIAELGLGALAGFPDQLTQGGLRTGAARLGVPAGIGGAEGSLEETADPFGFGRFEPSPVPFRP